VYTLAVECHPWMKSMKNKWTSQDDESLRNLWRTGVSVKCIQERLGFSRRQVMTKRKKLNLGARWHKVPLHTNRTSIYFTEVMRRAICRRAVEKGCTTTEYIRGLIRRDTGCP
jgi:hypothetical protein